MPTRVRMFSRRVITAPAGARHEAGTGFSDKPRRSASRARRAWTALVLLAGFAAAVGLRVAIGGADVAVSAPAGLAFAAALTALTVAAGTRTRLSWPTMGAGLAGAAVLCLPALLAQLAAHHSHRPSGTFLTWAAVVTVVAAAEEAFLRGALYDAIATWRGPLTAIAVTSACFAALHVPLYGWHVIPLDTAAGLWLGILRQGTDSWTTPAITHITADLAAWWLR